MYSLNKNCVSNGTFAFIMQITIIMHKADDWYNSITWQITKQNHPFTKKVGQFCLSTWQPIGVRFGMSALEHHFSNIGI